MVFFKNFFVWGLLFFVALACGDEPQEFPGYLDSSTDDSPFHDTAADGEGDADADSDTNTDTGTDTGTETVTDTDTDDQSIEECGGGGDSCYDDATAKTDGIAVTPLGKDLEYVYANGSSGLKVWKENGGDRVLRANGLDEWAKELNINGKGQSATDYTDSNLGINSSAKIVGRVCPPNVYIDDSNKFTTTNCLYYTASQATESLFAAGTSQTIDGQIGMKYWSNYTNGSFDPRWYVGNVQRCTDIGMRLPTLFETDGRESSGSAYPTSDDTAVFAESLGIPTSGSVRTASSESGSDNTEEFNYVTSGAIQLLNNQSHYAYQIICVLP